MVRLEDVSLLDFTNTYLTKDERYELSVAGVVNYKQFAEYISCHPEWRKKKFWDNFFTSCQKIQHFSKKVEPTIYEIPSYSDKALSYNDSLVYGSSLILNNPTTTNVGLTESLSGITIQDIKFRATHVNVYLRNMLETYNSVNPGRAKKVVSALWLYNAQIERQYSEIQRTDISLFYYLLEDRRELVQKQITDVLAYLIQNSEKGFVWGELSPTQKRKYVSALTNDFIPDMMLKDKVVEMVATNVTYLEASRGLTDGDTLDRFILK